MILPICNQTDLDPKPRANPCNLAVLKGHPSSTLDAMSQPPRRAIGYVRVSTEDQVLDGASLAAQETLLRTTAKLRGYDLIQVVVEAGVSGKSLARPEMQKALTRLAAGEAVVLMATALDRLTRSTGDLDALLKMSVKQGWRLLALNGDVDTTTAMGEAFIGIAAVFAQLERRLIGERTRAGMVQKRREGQHLGRRTALDPLVIDRIRSDRAAGVSWRRIASALSADPNTQTATGGHTWSVSSVQSAAVVNPAPPATRAQRVNSA